MQSETNKIIYVSCTVHSTLPSILTMLQHIYKFSNALLLNRWDKITSPTDFIRKFEEIKLILCNCTLTQI